MTDKEGQANCYTTLEVGRGALAPIPEKPATTKNLTLPLQQLGGSGAAQARIAAIAGVATKKLNSEKKHQMKLLHLSKRSYDAPDETDRTIKLNNIRKKDHQYYRLTDNLWNETKFLHPSIARYSHDNTDPKSSFKKTVRDLPKIQQIDRESKFSQQFEQLLKHKSDGKNRFLSRQTERLVNQYQSSQRLNHTEVEEASRLESENPMLFDEIANKKKWSYIRKNTTKAIRDQDMNNNYWNLLNHVSKSQVKSIVTPNVLNMDKRSCDGLLKEILKEKIADDAKKNLVQQERWLLRNKLALRHNQRMLQQERLGVKAKGRPQQLKGTSQSPDQTVQIHTVHPSLDVQLPNQASFDNSSALNDTTFLNSKRFNQTTLGDVSQAQQLDNSLFSDIGTGRSLKTQRDAERKNRLVTKDHLQSLDAFSVGRISMKTQYVPVKQYKFSDRLKILSMPKQQYHGKDFFQRPEFRGLLLADHQEAIGERAFRCVDSLNQDTVSQFNQIESFKRQISQKRLQQQYYKETTKLGAFMKTHKTKAQTSVPMKRSDMARITDSSQIDRINNESLQRRIKTSDFNQERLSGFHRSSEVTQLSGAARNEAQPPDASLPLSRAAKREKQYTVEEATEVVPAVDHKIEASLKQKFDSIESKQNAQPAHSPKIDFKFKAPKSLSLAQKKFSKQDCKYPLPKEQKKLMGMGKDFTDLTQYAPFMRTKGLINSFNNMELPSEKMSLGVQQNNTQQGVFAKGLRQPILKLQTLTEQSKSQEDADSRYNQQEEENTDRSRYREDPKKLKVMSPTGDFGAVAGNLTAAQQMDRNKTINVFGNNTDKTLGERVRDLNKFYLDASMGNMLEQQKFGMQQSNQTNQYINVTNMDDIANMNVMEDTSNSFHKRISVWSQD